MRSSHQPISSPIPWLLSAFRAPHRNTLPHHWASPWPKIPSLPIPSAFLNHCVFLNLTNTSSHLLLILGPKNATIVERQFITTVTQHQLESELLVPQDQTWWEFRALAWHTNLRNVTFLFRYGLYTLTDNKIILLFPLIFLTMGSSQMRHVPHLVASFCFWIKVERSFQVQDALCTWRLRCDL